MRGDRMPARVLAMRLIPRVDAGLREHLGLGGEIHALGLITCDSDDVGYTALDEATKKACVSVAYAQSMYAGAANANTALAGEFLGILAGETPAEVESGLLAARRMIEQEASFYSRQRRRQRHLLCALHLPHGQLSLGRLRNPGGIAAGVPYRAAAGEYVCAGQGAQGGAGAGVRLLWPAVAHQLWRRTAHRQPVGLSGGMRRVCTRGDRRGDQSHRNAFGRVITRGKEPAYGERDGPGND